MTQNLTWRWALALLTGVLAVLIGLFFETGRSMVTQWTSYETYTHGYVIAPISLWLIWQRRAQLALIASRPDPRAWALMALAVFGWLLADLGGVQVVAQYAFVAMLPLAAWSVLGWAVVRPILFPLAFLLLAVPFGEVFIDPLINWTADFTVLALQWTGIPVLRDGNSFSIPSGNWSVVTACSGVRYLIASFTLGCIYAYLTYRSTLRRVLFMLASVIVPIVANGVRAYGIVMIGHLSSMRYAVGVDHLIYGWLFFGLVMLILFWVGGFWREDEAPLPATASAATSGGPGATPAQLIVAAAMVLLVAGFGRGYGEYLDRAIAAPAAVTLEVPALDGWREAPAAFTAWRPEFHQPAGETFRSYAQGERQAGLYIAYYRHQHQGSELINYLNVLAAPGGEIWQRLGESTRPMPIAGAAFTVRQSRLKGGEQRLLAWHWYWIGGRVTASPYVAKLYQAWDRLLLRGDDSAVAVLFTPLGARQETSVATLGEFARGALPQIERTLNATRVK